MGVFSDIGQSTFGFYGSLIGELWAKGDDKEAERLRKLAFDEIDGLKIPEPEKLQYKAKLMQVTKLGPSAMEGVKVDPAYKQAAQDTMDRLQETADTKGMDAQARAALMQAQRETSARAKGEAAAIEGDAARRGISSSGLTLMAKLRNQQAAADRAAMAGVEAAAAGAERAQAANLQRGQMAGQMSDRDFGQQSQIAKARDAVAAQNAQFENEGSRFNAQTENEASRFNSGVLSDDYSRRRDKAGMMADAYEGRARGYDAKAARKRRIASAGGQILGKTAGEAMDIYSGGM